ncbi:PH domain-containing protein, partial [Bradyrhizobium sp. NBAIM08]|uniref:PH domain-containing protein n=1 Tax=Bradyrhizobium sp. NBAIM08 TaxID=2793815 RepID=UPI001CD5D732
HRRLPDLVPAEPVFVARPQRLRLIATITAVALVGLTLFGWFALPLSVRVLFTVSQLLTVLGVLALLILGMVSAAASYVRADTDGLTIRNGLRRHVVGWDRVHKIILRRGDPWATVLLRPADGSDFLADLDADKRMLMGIQA